MSAARPPRVPSGGPLLFARACRRQPSALLSARAAHTQTRAADALAARSASRAPIAASVPRRTRSRRSFTVNSIGGRLPSELGALAAATLLSVHINQLAGPIPTQLGLLTKLNLLCGAARLRVLAVARASRRCPSVPSPARAPLSDSPTHARPPSLPPSLPKRHSNMRGNQFTGTMPSQLGALTALSVLCARRTLLLCGRAR